MHQRQTAEIDVFSRWIEAAVLYLLGRLLQLAPLLLCNLLWCGIFYIKLVLFRLRLACFWFLRCTCSIGVLTHILHDLYYNPHEVSLPQAKLQQDVHA